jgi:hypothetical protein
MSSFYYQVIARVTLILFVGATFGIFITNVVNEPQIIVVSTVKESAMKAVNADAIARELLTPKSYKCLQVIIHKESRGNPTAKNSQSSARGIGQLLSSTYRNLGMKHSTDEKAQLIALLAYVGRKYGSGGPCAALAFHKKHNYF